MKLANPGVLSALLMALALPVAAQETAAAPEIDPFETEKALNLLLSHADQAIPENSSCYGHYLGTDAPAIHDLLATTLAYLYNGSNVIMGACVGDKCTIRITHEAGEDVSSTTIHFSVDKGRLDAASLQCLITP